MVEHPPIKSKALSSNPSTSTTATTTKHLSSQQVTHNHCYLSSHSWLCALGQGSVQALSVVVDPVHSFPEWLNDLAIMKSKNSFFSSFPFSLSFLLFGYLSLLFK
jgi:hypothetical protein